MAHALRIPKDALLDRLRRNPHWFLFALSLLCWANYLLLEMQQPSGTHHHHHATGIAPLQNLASQGAAWLVMVYAMMLPMLSGALRWLIGAQPRYLRFKAVGAFLLGYSGLWLLLGVVLAFLQSWISDLSHALLPWLAQFPNAAIGFLVAGVVSRMAYRRKAVYACGGSMPLRINGWSAIYDSLQFGIHKGIRCAASCLHLMVALLVSGHGMVLMLLVTAILFYERQQLPRKTRILELFCYLLAGYYLLAWWQDS